jgi:L-seryl-tRNA(Ser) seleniumtransferase
MLPSVNDVLLQTPLARFNVSNGQRERAVQAARAALNNLRSEIAAGLHTSATIENMLQKLPTSLAEDLNGASKFSLRRVINATGVLLHTNLGRAPLSEMALHHLWEIAAGYSNLEFDLERGERGKRDAHVEALLLTLFAEGPSSRPEQAKRAVIVNNCAAATFLALHALARGRQVLVSRAELIEIGGGFRIPEILEESGAILREVGTTNRTRVSDYERAITTETALILRVHQSNFTMEGFVERPTLEELTALGSRKSIGVFEDQGTGLVEGLEPYGIRGEATVAGSLTAGCDLVAASGDKLFGGPQCGILIGQSEWIDRIRSNPLFRTFRADKLSYAALEATLIQYLYGSPESIPVIRMLRMPADTVRDRCVRIAGELHSDSLTVQIVAVSSVIGGGTAPRSTLPSFALALTHERLDASALLAALRRLETPIVGRVEEDRVLLDLRNVEPEFDPFLVLALSQSFAISRDIRVDDGSR